METTGLKSSKMRHVFAAVIAVLMLAYVVCSSLPFFTYTRLDDKKLGAANAEIDQKVSDAKLKITELEKKIAEEPANAEALNAEISALKNEANNAQKMNILFVELYK